MPKLKVEINGSVVASSHKTMDDLLRKIKMIEDARSHEEKIVVTIEYGERPQFQQGGLDTLWSARHALNRAINAYEKCRNGPPLSLDEGYLFQCLDNLSTVEEEIETGITIIHQ